MLNDFITGHDVALHIMIPTEQLGQILQGVTPGRTGLLDADNVRFGGLDHFLPFGTMVA